MYKLGPLDDVLLRVESRRQPLHIGMLMLFDPGKDAPKEFVSQLAAKCRLSTQAAAPFNRRLESKGGLHYWKETDDFDIDHHFVHIALPKPGRVRELLAMVSRLHGGNLDRAYPLWRMYLIEGLEDGRFAVYFKIHHSIVDGIAGIKMLLNSMSTTVEGSLKLPPPWEVPVKRSSSQPPVPHAASSGLSMLRPLARSGLKSIKPVLRELQSNLWDYWSHNPDFVAAGQAPRCILNQSISATRRFAAQSYSTPRIRAVASAFDATLNDVVLAMCAGALRRYLVDMEKLPDRPLVAAVPVSIRRDNTKLGNEVAFTFAHLATQIDDPAERMLAIKSCMDYNKEHLKKLSPDQTLVCAAMKLIPGALNMIWGRRDLSFGNLAISHVPGPRRPMYWQGAKLCGLYPASLLIDGMALNITLVSRHDFVDFGLLACHKTLPHIQRLLGYLEDALIELEDAISQQSIGQAATKPQSINEHSAKKAKQPSSPKSKDKPPKDKQSKEKVRRLA